MKKFFTLLCLALVSAVGFAQDAYNPDEHTCFVSGTGNMFAVNEEGKAWQASDAMTYDAVDGMWKITLAAKEANKVIEFKVVYDGEWYGDEAGNNYQFQVSEVSDVLITFDPTTHLSTFSGDKVVAYDPNKIDFIVAAGSSALLNGQDWNVEAEVNKLVEVDDGYYELSIKGVKAGSYNFKFAANGAWATQWGATEGNENLQNGVAVPATGGANPPNFALTLEKGATYDVTLALDIMNPEAPMVTATWEKAGDDVITEDVYSLAGTFNGWDKDDEGAELTKVSEGVYSFSRSVKAGSYEFKIVKNHDWAVAYPADNYQLTLNEDADVTITLDLTAEPIVNVSTAECSVYFVGIKVKSSKESLKVFACYSDSWTPLTGDWPGERMIDMRDKEEGCFVSEDDLLLPKGEKLWLIFNDGQGGDGHQTGNIEVTGISSNTTLEYTINDDWSLGATGILAIETTKIDGAIYNIAGQRMHKAVRGLYIINGKKVVK